MASEDGSAIETVRQTFAYPSSRALTYALDAMFASSIHELRQSPVEWHRRGLLHPDEVEALVHHRLLQNVPAEPSYSDFFRASYGV